MLRLIPLGVGDAFSALYYSTSLALIANDGRWLLVDCPHPIHKILREVSHASGVELPLATLAGVCVTHLHMDHASGLEGLGYFAKYVLRDSTPPNLYSGPHVIDAFRAHPESEVFKLISVTEPTQAGPFTIETRKVTHGELPACAFRIRAGGRTLGHSGDTVFDVDLIRWLAESDFAIHEIGAMVEPNRLHTSYERLAALPVELRRKLHVAHYCDDFDVASSVIEAIRPGMVYEI
jgi:ribonuclease BN (tRNA processing enzyme)